MEQKTLLKSTKHYHVYVDRTSEGVPFYVGKGSTRRVLTLRRNGKHKHVAITHGINRIIEFETSDENQAFEQERRLIVNYHTFVNDDLAGPFACNFTIGGDGTSGFKWSDEAITRVSHQRKGKNNRLGSKHSQETKMKQRESKLGTRNPSFGKPAWNSGKHVGSNAAKKGWEKRRINGNTSSGPKSEETRRKISEAFKGRTLSEETRHKISKANTGRKHTKESKQRIAKTGIGRIVSAETRQKLSQANKGRILSAETRQKISETRKEKHHALQKYHDVLTMLNESEWVEATSP